MKTQLSEFIICLVLILFSLSIGHATDFNSIIDSAKKAAGKVDGSSSLSSTEIVQGLKDALMIGTQNAVASVSKTNGYYKNSDIKIPLPGEIDKAGKYLRMAGYGSKVDEFEHSMNRAAEQAAPEAKQIFVDAVKEMEIEDA